MAARNPALVVFNPRRRTHANPKRITKPTQMSRNVQAIAYVHTKDGQPYVHGFGDADLSEAKLKRGVLDLTELKMHTDVEMIYDPTDETILIRGLRGQSLAALFED